MGVNAKLTALNKLLLEENDRLTKQALQLSSENRFLKLRLESVNQALPKMENVSCSSGPRLSSAFDDSQVCTRFLVGSDIGWLPLQGVIAGSKSAIWMLGSNLFECFS